MKENSGEKICQQIAAFSDLRHKRVLEIGCGDGRISALLAQKPAALVAVDPDTQQIERARETIPGVDFRTGSGEALDFPDNSFDLVIFTLSLHHQNCKKALAEAARVAKPGEHILVVEPVIEGELEQVFAFLKNENNEKRQAQAAISESGLIVEASRVFTAEWAFDDAADLFTSLFAYYDMAYNPEIVANITDFLADKTVSSPLSLMDTMQIQSLIMP